ncbi:chemotaxis protein [Siculibacillus lacustris]|uniref:Chemotaxis protein n=1 Tax=Siculibacillus lacustris TaxID=1549641 RepID=A0A4Q9VFE6_9HYPH|nr:rod-binding protein [Siculibacillus lacustris]TBW33498.1 chemotaxis protein [Siculibacillus lacustris]
MAFDASVSLTTPTPALHVVSERPPANASPETKARTQAREFEQVFLSTMLNQMFSGLSTTGPFGGGQAEETWRGMLVDRYADTMARSGGIGIADAVYRQLLQAQEGARP